MIEAEQLKDIFCAFAQFLSATVDLDGDIVKQRFVVEGHILIEFDSFLSGYGLSHPLAAVTGCYFELRLVFADELLGEES